MNAINVVRFFNKPFLIKLKTSIPYLKNVQRNYSTPKHPSLLEKKPQSKTDVVLFKLENEKYFIGINVLSSIQCAVWTYLGLVLFRSADSPIFDVKGTSFLERIVQKEREYSTLLSCISIIFGWTVFISTALYSARSIRRIILHKDANYITLVTYNLPGYNIFKVPLHNISAKVQRIQTKKFIPIKVKNNYFHYLIDVSGEFSDPNLFDYTVGVRRHF